MARPTGPLTVEQREAMEFTREQRNFLSSVPNFTDEQFESPEFRPNLIKACLHLHSKTPRRTSDKLQVPKRFLELLKKMKGTVNFMDMFNASEGFFGKKESEEAIKELIKNEIAWISILDAPSGKITEKKYTLVSEEGEPENWEGYRYVRRGART